MQHDNVVQGVGNIILFKIQFKPHNFIFKDLLQFLSKFHLNNIKIFTN